MAENNIKARIIIRKATSAEWSATTATALKQGEFALDTTTGELKIATQDNQKFQDATALATKELVVGSVQYLGTVANQTELGNKTPNSAGDFCRVSSTNFTLPATSSITGAAVTTHAGDLLLCESISPSVKWSVIHGELDKNTWVANTASADGYVSKGSGHANKVWKTDANGNPGWRDDANTDTHYTNYLQIKGNGTEAIKFTQNVDKSLNLKPGNNVSISAATNEITINATVPTKSSWNYDDVYVKYSAAQSLTDAQKKQARDNIKAVSVDTNETISGVKTFTSQPKFTVASGTSPFTVSSLIKVDNLNTDKIDGFDISNYGYHYQSTATINLIRSNLVNPDALIYVKLTTPNRYYAEHLRFKVMADYDNIRGSTEITCYCRAQNKFYLDAISYNGNKLIGIYQPSPNTDIYYLKFYAFNGHYKPNPNTGSISVYSQIPGITLTLIEEDNTDYATVSSYNYIPVPGEGIYGASLWNDLYPSGNGSKNLGSSDHKWNNIYGTTIYENGTALSSKYLGISAKAADSAKLGGTAASSYATQTWVTNQGYTKNIGTVTAVKINGTSKNPTNGVVDLGTVLTAHQAVTNKAATLAWNTTSTIATIGSTDVTVKLPANPNIDTKNTTGTTNKTSTKMFLVGATEQAANPQTYSNVNVYIGTDNCLYSNGTKVLTAHQSLAGYATQSWVTDQNYVPLTMLGDAAAKNVDDKITNTANQLPTSAAVRTFVTSQGYIKNVSAAAGSDINTVGTPSVTVTNSGTTSTLTFHQLKGATGATGPKGDTGATGPKGETGAAAGFGTPTATVDANVGTPSVTITATGANTAKVFNFAFKNLKGQKGDTGPRGPQGEQGPKGERGATGATPTITASATVSNTIGTPSVTVTKGGTDAAPTFAFAFTNLKGAKGDPGVNATTTAVATTTANGLMSSADKTKLDGISADATEIRLSDMEDNLRNMATDLGNKVDAVDGKGLSTNDYTTADKTKLDSITIDADKKVQHFLNINATYNGDYTGGTFIINNPSENYKYFANDNNYETQAIVLRDSDLEYNAYCSNLENLEWVAVKKDRIITVSIVTLETTGISGTIEITYLPKFVTLTQSQYDALSTKDSNTFYCITGD